MWGKHPAMIICLFGLLEYIWDNCFKRALILFSVCSLTAQVFIMTNWAFSKDVWTKFDFCNTLDIIYESALFDVHPYVSMKNEFASKICSFKKDLIIYRESNIITIKKFFN